jgi:uncharacterized protein YbjT (DUF2867 family)
MSRSVLITGATGTLGRHVVAEAAAAGHQVRALSRKNRTGRHGVRWYRGDLRTGTGLDAAADGAEVIVHCATQPTGGKDVVSAANLIDAARRAGVAHIVYISIVGVDRIPLPYYAAKLRVEQALAAAGIGHTVLRATQFHDLITAIFKAQRLSPVLWALRGVSFQPIDTRDVAPRLVALVDAEPAGRVADIGGPAVHPHADLARVYLAARGGRRPVVALALPGRLVDGFRSGANLAPDHPVGAISYQQHLAGAG